MRRKEIVEIMAMLQHLRAGASNNQIKRELKVSGIRHGRTGNGPVNRDCLMGPCQPLKNWNGCEPKRWGRCCHRRISLV
jgi:hypothetical protein